MTEAQTHRGTEAQMRRVVVFLCLCASVPLCLFAQDRSEQGPQPFTIADILSAPFPSELVASPDGRAVAWIGDEQGQRNVWLAEAPAFRARRLTRWLADDGQELSELTWTVDGRALLVVRGGDPGANYDDHLPANPTSDPRGTDQSVWYVPKVGSARRVGEGYHPVPAPDGSRVIWILRDTLRTAPLRTAGAPQILFRARGAIDQQAFSPDGRHLVFHSWRRDHAFIGIYDFAKPAIRWVSPGTFHDELPRWSPDGNSIAFLRRPGSSYGTGPSLPPVQGSVHTPYAIRVADAVTLESREVWRSPNNSDGGMPGPAGDWTLLWAGSDRLVFASEQTGWIGMYAVPVQGGPAVRLTPSGCEVYDVTLTQDRDTLLYDSNCGNIDGRHVQKVPVTGGEPAGVTSGSGLEWQPQSLADGRVAMLRSDARLPASPSLLGDAGPATFDGWPMPAAFPMAQLVEPRVVTVRAADSTEIHLQVFMPPDSSGGRHPAMLYFHGGPQRQMLPGWHYRQYYHNGYAVNQYLASRGFIVVSVNYRGGVGYGRAFREAPRRGRFGGSEYQDLMAAAAWLRARPDVDTAHIGLWGGSYGGYMTALGLARNSDLFAAGFDLHGVHDYAEESNITHQFGISDSAIALARRSSAIGDVSRWRSPVLLVQGDDDRNVQFQQTVDLALRLRRQGVRVDELVFPDDIHDFLRHANWLTAYRRGAEFLIEVLRPAGGATGGSR